MRHVAAAAVAVLVIGLPAGTWEVVSSVTANHRAEIARLERDEAALKAEQQRLAMVFDTGTRGSCIAIEALRTGIITFVAGTVERSESSAVATVASPTATPQQKRVAEQNLALIRAELTTLQRQLPTRVCPKP